MKVGRPPKYKTAEEMQSVIDEYFAKCEDKEQIPTSAGIALALGMSRQTMWNYGEKDEFLDTIKTARARVEAAWEAALPRGGGGVVFWMKNNAGYRDEKHLDHKSSDGSMTPGVDASKLSTEALRELMQARAADSDK